MELPLDYPFMVVGGRGGGGGAALLSFRVLGTLRKGLGFRVWEGVWPRKSGP